jgi:hypothetical protein
MTVTRIDYGKGGEERVTHAIPSFPFPSGHRNVPHQTVEADSFVRDRQVSLIGDAFAVDQSKGSERSYCFVETVTGERRH